MAKLPPSHLEWIMEKLDRIEKENAATKAQILAKLDDFEKCIAFNHYRLSDLDALTHGIQQVVFPKMDRVLYDIRRLIGSADTDLLNPLDRSRRPKKPSK